MTRDHGRRISAMLLRWGFAFGLFLAPVSAFAANCGVSGANNCFWVGGTGTWDGSTTTNWANTSGGAGGSGPPTTGNLVTFDGNSGGGTVTVNTTVNVGSITMGAFTGALDFSANNNNVTLTAQFAAFGNSGTGTRTLNMGNGTWTLSATPVTFDQGTPTNLTFNADGSTLNFSNTSSTATKTLNAGGKTYNILTVASGGGISIGNSPGPTFATVNLTAPLAVGFDSGVTTTITNPFTWSGSSSAIFNFNAGEVVTGPTISAAAGSSISWAALYRMTFTGSAVNATNSFDTGGANNMNGGSITPPSGGVCPGHIIGG
jgi:hypothetical protein